MQDRSQDEAESPLFFEHGDCVVSEIYPWVISIGNQTRCFLWTTGVEPDDKDADHFVTDDRGTLIAFDSIAALRAACSDRPGFNIHFDEVAEFDMDEFWQKIRTLRVGRASSTATCHILLNGWNCIDDFLRSLQPFGCPPPPKVETVEKVYSKLFDGCNLPAITPEGKKFHPFWTEVEVTAFQRYMKQLWNQFLNYALVIP